jgi:hypothetical protein
MRRCSITGGYFGVRFQGNHSSLMEDCQVTGASDTGLVFVNGPAVRVRRCTITAENDGAQLCDTSTGSIEGCDIRSNGAVALVMRDGADVVVSSCTISATRGVGVQVHSRSKGTFADCTITNGPGFSTVEIRSESDPTFRNCSMNGGLSVMDGGLGTLENCVIQNPGSNVVDIRSGDPVLRGCTIYGGAQGVVVRNGRPTVVACQIRDNDKNGILLLDDSAATVRNCAVTKNKGYGVAAERGAGGEVADCEIRGNTSGAWEVPLFARLKRTANRT